MASFTDKIALSGIFVAIGLGFIQQCNIKADRQRVAAFEYVSLKHQDPYMSNVQKFNKSLNEEDGIRLKMLQNEQNRGDHDSEWNEIISEVGIKTIVSIADLHQSIIQCISKNICDKKIIEIEYKSDIINFYCHLSRYDQFPLIKIKKFLNIELGSPKAEKEFLPYVGIAKNYVEKNGGCDSISSPEQP